MRKLEEIRKDIEELDNQMRILIERKEALYDEKCERLFADFCDKHGIKSGDIVELSNKTHDRVQVVALSREWSYWVLCRMIKTNGEPYYTFHTRLQSEFEGCKVIRHIED